MIVLDILNFMFLDSKREDKSSGLNGSKHYPNSISPSVYVPPLMLETNFRTHTEPQSKQVKYIQRVYSTGSPVGFFFTEYQVKMNKDIWLPTLTATRN
jgi:hypothetical protein